MRLAVALTACVAFGLLTISAQAGHHRTTKHEHCQDARKGVSYYRDVTWNYQDLLREGRYSTRHPEKWKGHCAYLRYVSTVWHGRATQTAHIVWSLEADPRRAIRYVFGSYGYQAINVSWCESRWHTTSQNGQYLGLFQMGTFARERFGHGSDALTQSFAAYDYFVYSGRNWGPWSCKPWS